MQTKKLPKSRNVEQAAPSSNLSYKEDKYTGVNREGKNSGPFIEKSKREASELLPKNPLPSNTNQTTIYRKVDTEPFSKDVRVRLEEEFKKKAKKK